MQIGLDELYRRTARGDWSLAAFWLPLLFWRHLLAEQGTPPWEIREVLETLQPYHLFLVQAACRQEEGGVVILPASRLRSCLTLRDGDGVEHRVVKTKLPPQMRGLLKALAQEVNEGNPRPFAPIVFSAEEEGPFPFPNSLGELRLTAQFRDAAELSLEWTTLPAPPELPRPRLRRRSELRRA